MALLELHGVTKFYGKEKVLDNLDLTINQGKSYALMGRNGSGKSTLLSLISNYTFAQTGTILYEGYRLPENDKYISKISHMTEKTYFSRHARPSKLFEGAQTIHEEFDISYAQLLATRFRINQEKRLRLLPSGTITLVKFILALAAPTQLVLLDNPFLGLDAATREMVQITLLEEIKDRRRTFIITTEHIEENRDLFDEVILLRDGRLALHTSIEEFGNKASMTNGCNGSMQALFVKLANGLED